MARQSSAKARTAVRIRFRPPILNPAIAGFFLSSTPKSELAQDFGVEDKKPHRRRRHGSVGTATPPPGSRSNPPYLIDEKSTCLLPETYTEATNLLFGNRAIILNTTTAHVVVLGEITLKN